LSAGSSTNGLFDISGKTVLVTGGSSGIGLHLCHMLIEHGARVVSVSRKASESQQLRVLADRSDGNLLTFDMDISQQESVEETVNQAVNACGRIDVLVNSAGTVSPERVSNTSQNAWQSVIDTNLSGAFYVSQAVANNMPDGGSIIHVASISAYKAIIGLSAYAASKAGVVLLSRTLAIELAPQKIRVNVVVPGYVVTPMNENFLTGQQGEKVRKQIPLGRFAKPADLDGAVVFLASDASSYVTGSSLVIDGGYLA
jgi:NAD(P)-dependent dehydrogenase (short-subunit alcohol dehydrogenase family)